MTTQARPRRSKVPPLAMGKPGAHCDERSPPLAAYIASSERLNAPENSASRRMRARPSDVPSQR